MENNLKFQIKDLFSKIVSSRLLNQINGLSYCENKNLFNKIENVNIRDYSSLTFLKNFHSWNERLEYLVQTLIQINELCKEWDYEFDFSVLENCKWDIYDKYFFLTKSYVNFLAKKIKFHKKVDQYIEWVMNSLDFVIRAVIKENLHISNKWKNVYLTETSLTSNEIKDLLYYQLKKQTKIFYCDFDDFWLFNKLFWQHHWDQVIVKFMQILNNLFCWTQTWYRYGWEEFMWICDKKKDLKDLKSFFSDLEDKKLNILLDEFLAQEKNKFLDIKQIQKKLKIDIFPTNWSVVFWNDWKNLFLASTRRYAPRYKITDLRRVRWKLKKEKNWWVEIFVSIWETSLKTKEEIYKKIEKAEKIAIWKKRNEVLEIEYNNWWKKIKNHK